MSSGPGANNWSTAYTVQVSQEAMDGLRAVGAAIASARKIKRLLPGAILKGLPPDPTYYVDARPANLKAMDIDLLESRRFPIWDLEYEKVPFTITMSPRTRSKLLTISEHFHITNYRTAISYRVVRSRIAATIEAIGCGLLEVRLGPTDDSNLES